MKQNAPFATVYQSICAFCNNPIIISPCLIFIYPPFVDSNYDILTVPSISISKLLAFTLLNLNLLDFSKPSSSFCVLMEKSFIYIKFSSDSIWHLCIQVMPKLGKYELFNITSQIFKSRVGFSIEILPSSSVTVELL